MRLTGLNKFRIGNTQVGAGNATNADLLLNKTASADIGDLVGSIPNKVGSAIVITPSGSDQAIPQGYYGGATGDGKVAAVVVPVSKVLNDTIIAGQQGTMPNRGIEATLNAMSGDFGQVEFILPSGYYGNSNGDYVYITVLDPNGKFNPENIRAGITMFNAFPGTFTADATATADKIRSGYTAGINGSMVTGSIPTQTGQQFPWSNSNADTDVSFVPPAGYWDGSTSCYITDGNLVPGNIKNGISLFGVTGTNVYSFAPGDNIFVESGENGRNISTSDGLVYIYEWVPPISGIVRFYFGLSASDTAVQITARVMQGSAGSRTALGTARVTNSTTPIYYSEDLPVTAGVPICIATQAIYGGTSLGTIWYFSVKTTIVRNSVNTTKQTT